MAKTTAPLLSFGAEGQIAKSMVFASWRGVPYARRYVKPANPSTLGQQTTRTTFAFLREVWKLAPAILKAPWDSFALGRAFTGMNALVGENMRVLRAEPDLTLFIGSPGARGGIPANSFAAAATANAGQLLCTFGLPDAPDGWAISYVQVAALQNVNPGTRVTGSIVAGETAAPGNTVLLTGLTSATGYAVAGWIKWTKPDGTFAYSVGITDIAQPL